VCVAATNVCFGVVGRARALLEWYNERIMSDRVIHAAAVFQALSLEERLKVIRTVPESEQRLIMEGLSEAEDDDDASEDVSRAWGKEITSRIDDIDSGRVKLIPYEETLARAREAIRRAR
jgi:hypothetical protein